MTSPDVDKELDRLDEHIKKLRRDNDQLSEQLGAMRVERDNFSAEVERLTTAELRRKDHPEL